MQRINIFSSNLLRLAIIASALVVFQLKISSAQFKSSNTKIHLGKLPPTQRHINVSLENKSTYIINTISQIEGEIVVVVKENLNLYPGEITHFSVPIRTNFKGKIEQLFSVKINDCENLINIRLNGRIISNSDYSNQKCPDFKKNKSGRIKARSGRNNNSQPIGIDKIIIPVVDNLPVEAKPLDSDKYKKNNLIFLIDVSSSMQSTRKKAIVYEAFTGLAEIMRPSDQITILAYAGQAQVLLETTQNLSQRELFEVIQNLKNNGLTNGSEGIQFAYHLADSIFVTKANNEIILLTDGAFNANETEEISADIISKYASSGIKLSIIGIDNRSWAAKELKDLCNSGNGNYSGVRSKKSAKKALKRTLKNHAKSKS